MKKTIVVYEKKTGEIRHITAKDNPTKQIVDGFKTSDYDVLTADKPVEIRLYKVVNKQLKKKTVSEINKEIKADSDLAKRRKNAREKILTKLKGLGLTDQEIKDALGI